MLNNCNSHEISKLNLIKGKNLILYGAGELGVTFLVRIAKKYDNINVKVVIDRKFKNNEEFYGIFASSMSNYNFTEEDRKSSIVIIAVAQKNVQDEIRSCFDKLRFNNIMLVTDIYELQLMHSPQKYAELGNNYYSINRNKIIEAFNLFNDEISQKIFILFLSTHMLKKFIQLPASPREEQYFPKDIYMRKGYSRIINCGSYTGDTVKQLNENYGKISAVACFEPEPKNLNYLLSYLNDNGKEIADEIIVFPCGVYDQTTQVCFSSADASSSIVSDGGCIIQCVSLDDVLPTFKPTFINMDIEGAELEAIKGAKKIIIENIPDLAICVYQSLNHLWEIALFIKYLNLDYKFYLRTYTNFTNETVLYATTK